MQRVKRAEVRVADECIGRIDSGAVVLLGVMRGDGEQQVERLAERVSGFRFFSDDEGKMNRSVKEVGGSMLVVSQVTLAADGKKGRRPSLDRAAPPEDAERLYGAFVTALEARGVPCVTGSFGAMMEVELLNDGPVTFVLEDPPAA